MTSPLLQLNDLRVRFKTHEGTVRAVDGVSLHVNPGETLGLVGESGCGKSVTAYTVLRLLAKNATIPSGSIMFQRRHMPDPIDLAKLDPQGDVIRSIRGNEIAMIFQEPMTSLSPVHTIGSQISEAVELHQKATALQARERAIEMLERVGIGNPRQRINDYPHNLSGGMRQRAMIAMALSCNPALLIADEPTTALDVTIQAQIVELMMKLQRDFGMAILMITHNLGLIAEMADRVAVMYMGKIVELADVKTLFRRPIHPYTIGLLNSVPKMGHDVKQRLAPIPGSVPGPYEVPEGCAFMPR